MATALAPERASTIVAGGGLSPEALVALQRLRRNYALWAERVYRIRTKAGAITPLALNPVQRRIGAIEREELRARGKARLYVLKGRQGGITTDQQARALHLIWSTPNVDALTLAHKRDATDKIFAITRRAIRRFPPELRPRLGDRETREISFPLLDSHFYTETAGAGEVARGVTLRRLHCSEFAFYEDPEAVLTAAEPALVPFGSTAILETTASAYGSEPHVIWQECVAGARSYRAVFVPWWECDVLNYRLPLEAPDELGALTDEERELVERRGLDLEQLKWRRQKMADMHRAEFLREYAEDPDSCWLAAGERFFDTELLKSLHQRTPTPLRTEMDGALEIYGELEDGERAIIGADTAEGVGGDRSAFVARAFPSWRLLARFASDRIEPTEFADVLNVWGRRFRVALLVPEKNAHGITVIRRLVDVHKYPADRIYHRLRVDANKPEKEADLRKRLGWHTGGETKPLLLDAGRELLNAAGGGTAEVPAAAVLTEAFSVHRDKSGRVDLNGRDNLVSEMLAWIGRGYPLKRVRVFVAGVNVDRDEEEDEWL